MVLPSLAEKGESRLLDVSDDAAAPVSSYSFLLPRAHSSLDPLTCIVPALSVTPAQTGQVPAPFTAPDSQHLRDLVQQRSQLEAGWDSSPFSQFSLHGLLCPVREWRDLHSPGAASAVVVLVAKSANLGSS